MAIVYFPKEGEKRILCDNSFLIEERGLIFKAATEKLDNHVKAGFLRKLDIPSLTVEQNATHLVVSDKTYEQWLDFLSGKVVETPKEPEVVAPAVEEKTDEVKVANEESNKDESEKESSVVETPKEDEKLDEAASEESEKESEETKEEAKKKAGRPPKVAPAVETPKEASAS